MFDLNPNQLFSTAQENTNVITFSIKVNDKVIPSQYEVISIEVNRAVNRIPFAIITLLDGEVSTRKFPINDSNTFAPGNRIEIKVGYSSKNKTVFKGIVVRHAMKIKNQGASTLEIECKDVAVKMTAGRKNKYFFDSTDSEIIESVARSYNIKTDVETSSGSHAEMVQFHASDWDFILTRAEANGLLVMPQDGELIAKKPNFEQAPALVLNYGASIYEFEAEMDARDQYPAVKATTWNPADQDVQEVEASASGVSASGGGLGGALGGAVGAVAGALGVDLPGTRPNTDYSQVMGLSHFDIQHSGHLSAQELQNWATAQYQKSKLAKQKGRVKFEGNAKIVPGNVIQIQGVGLRHNGKVFATAVRHEILHGTWYTHVQFGLSQTWIAAAFDNVQQEPASSLLPAVHGLQIGVVTKLAGDPRGEDRIQVRLPLVDNRSDGIWVRIACQDAGENRGSFFRPEIGDEVIVGFINDDPRESIVLGMLNSSAKPAPLPAADANNEKGWVTRSEIKVIFNDEDKSIKIETPGGKKITIDDTEGMIQLEDEYNNRIKLDQNGIEIQAGKDLKLSAQNEVTIEGLNITNTAQTNFKAQGQTRAELTASGEVVVSGGVVRIN